MLKSNESQIIKEEEMSLKFNQTERSAKVTIFKVISYPCFHSISFLGKSNLMYDIIFLNCTYFYQVFLKFVLDV